MTGFDPARFASEKVDERAALRRLARLERRARFILIFETLWPPFVASLTLFGAIATLVLLGAFDLLRPELRGLALIAVAGAASALLIRSLLTLHITREDDLERIDRDSKLFHRPALSLADFHSSHLEDPLTLALWRAHRQQLVRQANTLRLAWPSPRVVDKDPYALRFLVLIGLAAAIIVTGPEGTRRLDSALIWTSAGEAIARARLDGWIDPPPYTRLPPILFDFQSEIKSKTIRAPIGSTLVLRRSDNVIGLPDVSGKLTVIARGTDETKPDATEKRFTLIGDAAVNPGGSRGGITIETIPDNPPTIAFLGGPQKTKNGGISLNFHVEDDYGVASGSTRILNPREGSTLLTGAHEPLVAAPDLQVTPSGDKRKSDGRVTFDRSDSPWAGAMVDVALMVKDDAGQIAEAGLVTFRLPARLFTTPVARALVEERQRLALDPSTLLRVREAIDLLMTAPDLFAVPAAEYLGLRSIRTALDDAEGPDDLRAVLDLIWNVALAIENGGDEDAAKALNNAEAALRHALENGASDDEIRTLSEKLKQALDAYLKDYANRAMKQMGQNTNQDDPSQTGRAIRPEDLKAMIDRMQDMAQSGARDDAQRMLDALSSILKNLQASRPQLGNPSQEKSARSLNGLDKLTREQRGLRDDTFRQGRDNPDAGQNLSERQHGLRGALGQLKDAIKGLGQDGQDALGQAKDAMERAEDALKNGDIAGALREQNKALEGLRSGAQALAKSMQEQNGNGDERGEKDGGPDNRFGQSQKNDPLGRENGDANADDDILKEGRSGESVGDRARNVLNELRKRLGEDARTKEERDYYRRLIGPN